LPFFCRKPYILGEVPWSAVYHKELAMNGQPQNTPLLAALPPKERSRALERYRILQPFIEHEVPLTHVTCHHGIPLRTVQRWLAHYRRDGFTGLARRERSDRRQPHGLLPELKQLIEGFTLLTIRRSTGIAPIWHNFTAEAMM
jgi:hypothetical protein